MEPRYLIIVLGSSKGVEDILSSVASPDFGVNYVDGNGIYIATFFSPFTTLEIQDIMKPDLQAFLLFDITNDETNTVNLPSKYYKGLFPETDEILDKFNLRLGDDQQDIVEEYDNVDDILDKLSRNNYNRKCLTKKELKILEGNK